MDKILEFNGLRKVTGTVTFSIIRKTLEKGLMLLAESVNGHSFIDSPTEIREMAASFFEDLCSGKSSPTPSSEEAFFQSTPPFLFFFFFLLALCLVVFLGWLFWLNPFWCNKVLTVIKNVN